MTNTDKIQTIQKLILWISKEDNPNFKTKYEGMLADARRDVRALVIDTCVNLLDEVADSMICSECGAANVCNVVGHANTTTNQAATDQAPRCACNAESNDSLYDRLFS